MTRQEKRHLERQNKKYGKVDCKINDIFYTMITNIPTGETASLSYDTLDFYKENLKKSLKNKEVFLSEIMVDFENNGKLVPHVVTVVHKGYSTQDLMKVGAVAIFKFATYQELSTLNKDTKMHVGLAFGSQTDYNLYENLDEWENFRVNRHKDMAQSFIKTFRKSA